MAQDLYGERNPEKIRETVKAYDESGLTAREFCVKTGITPAAFDQMRYRVRYEERFGALEADHQTRRIAQEALLQALTILVAGGDKTQAAAEASRAVSLLLMGAA